MPDIRTDYTEQLRTRFSEIDTLRTTPDMMRGMAVKTLDNAIKTKPQNTTLTVLNNGRTALVNIRDESIANNYRIIYAQMCVLAVSSLETILKSYFINAANSPNNLRRDNKRLGQMKLTIEEVLAANLRFGGKLGDLIIQKDNFSLQDLKSIKDVFEIYFGKSPNLSPLEEKKACFYLEARHCIVHRGGIADEKFIRAVSTMNANLKNIELGQAIQLDANDWQEMRNVFIKIVQGLTVRTN